MLNETVSYLMLPKYAYDSRHQQAVVIKIGIFNHVTFIFIKFI